MGGASRHLTGSPENPALVQLGAAAKGAAGIFVLRVAGACLGFLISILLARFLGATGLGIYTYALAWIAVLLIPATLGFQQLLPREVAIHQSRLAWGKLLGLLVYSQRTVLLLALTIAVIAAAVAWLFASGGHPSTTIVTFWIALILLPLNALVQVRQSTMRGLGRVVLGQLPESVLAPAAAVLLLVGLDLLAPASISPVSVIAITVTAATIAFAIGDRLLAATLPQPVKQVAPILLKREWIASAIPMVMITGLEIINTQTDLIMLGAMLGERATGLYSPAVRGASLVVFVWASVNMAIGPVVARAYHHGAYKQLQDLIHKSALVIFFGTLPICFALLVFPTEFLSLFGPEFVRSDTALRILLIGNLVNSVAGSVGLILKMTGNERDVLWTGLCAAAANIGLNAVLIPLYGIEGAAVATTISMSIWPIAAGVIVYKRTAINPTIFPVFRGLRSASDTGL